MKRACLCNNLLEYVSSSSSSSSSLSRAFPEQSAADCFPAVLQREEDLKGSR